MVPHTPKTPAAPISNLRSESEASHLMTTVSKVLNNRHPLGEIEVRSKEQPHMSLGNFSNANPPKGFAIHIMKLYLENKQRVMHKWYIDKE